MKPDNDRDVGACDAQFGDNWGFHLKQGGVTCLTLASKFDAQASNFTLWPRPFLASCQNFDATSSV